MTAHDQMKAMLDQLMGTGRDGENNKFKVNFDDSRVCKSFLMGCCPHEILSSTRMDLGECPRIHDLALKADFEMASKNRDYYYDIDAMEHLTQFVQDCDRRTVLAKKRLKETQEELSEESTTKAEDIHQLGEQIGTKLAKAEELGAEGNVEESLSLMQEVEDLKTKKSNVEQDYRNSMPASSYQQQKLRVCEVCSAYLGIHDNDRRLADHFGGKLHLGFISIREKLVDLQKSVKDRRDQREAEREVRRRKEAEEAERRKQESDERRRKREESRERRRKRSRSHSRERRHKRSRSRHRRSRSRHRRSRSRHHRSRSRSSRHRRSRSRSNRRHRSHSRSRHRRHRSRSRSKNRRSRHSRRSRSRHSRSKSGSRHSNSKNRSRHSRSRHSRSNSRSGRRSSSRSRSRSKRSTSSSRKRSDYSSRSRSSSPRNDQTVDTAVTCESVENDSNNGNYFEQNGEPIDE